VENTLAKFIEEDFNAIVQSGILKGELEAARNEAGWSRLKRKRR
jgi:hypothetical protein